MNNCVEFNAINNALFDRADRHNLNVYSIYINTGNYPELCLNCQDIYSDFVNFIDEGNSTFVASSVTYRSFIPAKHTFYTSIFNSKLFFIILSALKNSNRIKINNLNIIIYYKIW